PLTRVSRSRSIVRRSRSLAPKTSSTAPCSSTWCRFCQRSSYDWYWKSGARFPEPYFGRGASARAAGALAAGAPELLCAELVAAAPLARATGWTALPSVVDKPGAAASRVIANQDANDTAFPLESGRESEARRMAAEFPGPGGWLLQAARHLASSVDNPASAGDHGRRGRTRTGRSHPARAECSFERCERSRLEQRRLVQPAEPAGLALEREVAPAREQRERHGGDAEPQQHLRVGEPLEQSRRAVAGEEPAQRLVPPRE